MTDRYTATHGPTLSARVRNRWRAPMDVELNPSFLAA